MDEQSTDPLRATSRFLRKTPLGTIGMIVLAFVALGLWARANRYLQGWDPWGDETAVAISIVERDYRGLTGVLDGCQIAPVGFLWLAKAATESFGVNEWALRFPAFLFSAVALVAVAWIARSLLKGWEVAFAVAIFAVSNYHIRHAAEMKQYAMECGIAALLIAVGVSAARSRPAAMLALIVITPLAILGSLTAVFVAGGISLAVLPMVRERPPLRWWAWYASYNLAVLLSFLGVYFSILRPQLETYQSTMTTCWETGMIDWRSPSSALVGLFRMATGSIFAHPFGGEKGESIVNAGLFWFGIAMLWRRDDRLVLRIIGGVFGLAAVAAVLGKFPLGGHPRIVLYLSPLVVLPMAAGIASLLAWRSTEAALPRRRAVVLGMLLFVGIAGMAKDLAKPYFNTHSQRVGQFARWFWNDYAAAAPGPLARVVPDQSLPVALGREFSFLHMRHAKDPRRVPPIPLEIDRPTGLVLGTLANRDTAKALDDWLAALSERYEVFDQHRFLVDAPTPAEAIRYEVVWIRPLSSRRSVPAQPVHRLP